VRARSSAPALLVLAHVVLLASATAAVPPEGSATRRQVEEDWRRHDAQRTAQLAQPGVLRFPSGAVSWPGVVQRTGLVLPRVEPPTLDGRLDDDCWSAAATVAPEGDRMPSYRLCHDFERLYVSAEMPEGLATAYRGDPTGLDASGAVDGVKNGLYAFHTGGDANPWWQVDLGAATAIGRIVVYNRLDYAPGLHNADNLVVLASDDATTWREVYRNPGTFFGGVDATGPLQVSFPDLTARYVRLQVPAPGGILFDLDEVEVYPRDRPESNVALHSPASQSSLSIWSRGGPTPAALLEYAGHRVTLSADEPLTIVSDGAPLPGAAARAEDGTLRLEFALPLRDAQGALPGAARLARPDPTPFCLGADWELRWPEAPKLGYGRNRLTIELRCPRPLAGPVTIQPEFVVLTPFGIERRPGEAVTARGAGPVEITADLALEGPAQLVLTARQGPVEVVDSRTFFVAPVEESLARARSLLRDSGRPAPSALQALEDEAHALSRRERDTGTDPGARDVLYRRARWLARDVALEGLGIDRLLFARRFTQQAYPDVCLNHMPWVSRPGGDLCVLSPLAPDGAAEPIIRGALGPGHVHGFALDWDAQRIVFGYARARSDAPPEGWLDRRTSYDLRRTEEPTHLYEIGVDGSGIRQLTEGEWSDLDPAILPNGDVAFVSERCGYSLQCNEYDKDETSCNLYLRSRDGSIKRLSDTKDGDYLPQVLTNGLLAYTRWEYQERSFANIQSIWVIRPDGSGADALFKQHLSEPWALEETRSIPGSPKLAAIATGHHTLPVGSLAVIDQKRGINAVEGIRLVTPGVVSPEGGMQGLAVPEGGVQGTGGLYATPWAISEKAFLVSYTYGGMTDETGYSLYLVDVYGTRELLYDDPEMSCFGPMPLLPRQRPPVLSDSRAPNRADATCVVTDVYEGLPEVPRGTIRYLRVSQGMPWPYTIEEGGFRYEPDVKTAMVNWNPARVLGTVPVEADGSAHFRLPADTAVFFQALDDRHREVRRMRSFLSFQPGEQRSCNGCHETRGIAPASGHVPTAGTREPSPLEPAPWGDRAVSFLRDVQPVLDRKCVGCHAGLTPPNGVDLSGGLEGAENRSWHTINGLRLVVRSSMSDDAKITPPYAFGSTKSRLIEVLDTTHRDRVRLSDDEWLRLVMWVDLNAPYHGEFLNKRPAVAPYDLAADQQLTAGLAEIHGRRCGSCHEPALVSASRWIDLRAPERSAFLTAPLAAEAGGTAQCGAVTYASVDDPDYRTARGLVERAVGEAWARPRRDVATLEPPAVVAYGAR
jgi:hypothetical protein